MVRTTVSSAARTTSSSPAAATTSCTPSRVSTDTVLGTDTGAPLCPYVNACRRALHTTRTRGWNDLLLPCCRQDRLPDTDSESIKNTFLSVGSDRCFNKHFLSCLVSRPLRVEDCTASYQPGVWTATPPAGAPPPRPARPPPLLPPRPLARREIRFIRQHILSSTGVSRPYQNAPPLRTPLGLRPTLLPQ